MKAVTEKPCLLTECFEIYLTYLAVKLTSLLNSDRRETLNQYDTERLLEHWEHILSSKYDLGLGFYIFKTLGFHFCINVCAGGSVLKIIWFLRIALATQVCSHCENPVGYLLRSLFYLKTSIKIKVSKNQPKISIDNLQSNKKVWHTFEVTIT